MKDYYQVLGIASDSDFTAVKKAYYRRAKECHPDRHGNSKAKEEEFKLVAEAFDILSDPLRRQQFDRLAAHSASSLAEATADAIAVESVMDTPADDILEELITGNAVPLNTNLSTIMQDLTRSEVFIDFREGKNLFYRKQYRSARNFFIRAVDHSPGNIVYRCFLARTCAALGDYSRARKEYHKALELGTMRSPPQTMRRVRRELDDILKKHSPWWYRLFGISSQSYHELSEDSAADMIEETNRSLARLSAVRQKKDAAPPPPKLLKK